MIPPGIEPESHPRQGYVLATGLWDPKDTDRNRVYKIWEKFCWATKLL